MSCDSWEESSLTFNSFTRGLEVQGTLGKSPCQILEWYHINQKDMQISFGNSLNRKHTMR